MAAITDFNDGDKIRLKYFAYDRYFVVKVTTIETLYLDEWGRITIPNITDIRSKDWYLYQA